MVVKKIPVPWAYFIDYMNIISGPWVSFKNANLTTHEHFLFPITTIEVFYASITHKREVGSYCISVHFLHRSNIHGQ